MSNPFDQFGSELQAALPPQSAAPPGGDPFAGAYGAPPPANDPKPPVMNNQALPPMGQPPMGGMNQQPPYGGAPPAGGYGAPPPFGAPPSPAHPYGQQPAYGAAPPSPAHPYGQQPQQPPPPSPAHPYGQQPQQPPPPSPGGAAPPSSDAIVPQQMPAGPNAPYGNYAIPTGPQPPTSDVSSSLVGAASDGAANPFGAAPAPQAENAVGYPAGAPAPGGYPTGTDYQQQAPYGQPPQQQDLSNPFMQQPYGAAPPPQQPPAAPPTDQWSQSVQQPPPPQNMPPQQIDTPAAQDPFSVFNSAPAPPPAAPAPPAAPQQQQQYDAYGAPVPPAAAPAPQPSTPAPAADPDDWSNMFGPSTALVPAGGGPKVTGEAPGSRPVNSDGLFDAPVQLTETGARPQGDDLPPGGEYYDAKIFTPTLGVMFFKPQELTDSLFLQTDRSLVDALAERPVVAFIVEGSSARSAGVELGHVLLKVNGVDVRNPKEASRLIKEGPRPLPLLFYVPNTTIVTAEGEHMVKYDTKETTAPNSANQWKPKYVVIGGIIAQPWMMNMYRSKSEYDIAVIETQARRPVSVKVKQFSLQGARIQNDWQGPQMVKYKNKLHPWKYIVVLPVARNPIKISSPNLSQLKPVHEGIRRVLMAQKRDHGQRHGGGYNNSAAPQQHHGGYQQQQQQQQYAQAGY